MGCWGPAVADHNCSRDRHSLIVQWYTKTIKLSVEEALLKYRLFNDECVEIRREKTLSFTNKINSELGGFHRRKVYISKCTCELDLHSLKAENKLQSFIFLVYLWLK